MKIMVLDNYDSFTYNLVHILKELIRGPVDVHRNDEIGLDYIGKYDKIIISPGPGVPGKKLPGFWRPGKCCLWYRDCRPGARPPGLAT